MNISQPVSSALESVEFAFLSPDEIRSISVKRIENDATFDSLLNPVPGGLYDTALGSWGDSPCSTCNLVQSSCPGHPGHIELPVHVYNPVFMDQTYRLLRAQCVYCSGFKMASQSLHLVICKLKLLQYGLVREALHVEAIGMDLCGFGADDWPDQQNLSLEATEEGREDVPIIRARDKYVGRVIRHHHHHRLVASSGDVVDAAKHEGASEMRRAVIKDFLATVTQVRKCGNCLAVSPAYRKDRFVKIFEKVLSNKAKNENAKQNLKAANAITAKIGRQMRRGGNGHGGGNEDDLDEGVADVDAFPPEQERGEVQGAAAAAIAPGSGGGDGDQRYLPTPEVHARLQRLFEREQELLQLLYNARPPRRGESNRVTADIFFLKTLLVPPNRYRPETRTGDSQISEAQQNSLYKKIMQHSIRIAQVSRVLKDPGAGADPEAEPAVEPIQNANIDTLYQACADLQGAVNALVDKTKNPAQGRAAQRNEDGIKQKLEKKEGLFRMNMMGKRVNYAGRSVISPDPNLETNEIGVPVVFARKLTYPEPVTSHNYRDLQQAVLNGPSLWPGASAVQDESGKIVNLRGKSMEERMTIANQLLTPTSSGSGGGGAGAYTNKKVFRHLTNGDVVLMNRQPSLHRPSIMGHRVRVLPGEKTLRMHYANCNAYNADFDGDEMNMHFPQNEMARIEALQVADTDHQYISTTQGAPLRGLIQDHISVAVDLCSRDTMLSRDSYHLLVYGALRPESGHLIAGDRILTVPAAILRPVRRWTGKQVITTILKNLTPAGAAGLWMSADTKISAAEWGSAVSEEGVVRFQDGEFVTGILDKSHIGPSPGGLVHAVHEVYGPNIAGRLLSSLGRLLTKYLNMRAFSCGMDDLRLTAEGEKRRKALLGTGARIGRTIAADYVSLDTSGRGRQGKEADDELAVRLEEVMRDDGKQEGLDRLMNGACDMIKDEVNKGLMPATLVKKFPRNRMQTMTLSGAKGTRVNATLISCSLGQQVLEGRRVPLMVSGKSLPCFEPFETDARAGGFVANRFLTGIRPQEYYFHHMTGREGLIDTAVKTSRSGYLQRCLIKGMEGLTVTYDSTVRDSDGSLVQFLYGEDGLDVTRQRYLNDFRFTLLNREAAQQQLRLGPDAFAVLARRQAEVRKHMRVAVKYARAGNPRGPDPVSSMVNPARHAGATSERFFEAMTEYIRLNPDGLVGGGDVNNRKSSTLGKEPASRRFAETLFEIKYIRSLVEPGEAVGIVAGQSVGEPSTQMTLNTFHLAGHSGKNVTLGIPRLREILMTARKTISTPTMTLYLNRDVSPEAAERFAKSIGILPMSNILDEASVRERTGRAGGGRLQKIYDIRLDFFPAAEYAAMYGITAGDVMRSVEVSLLPRLRNLIAREIKKRKASQGATAAAPEIGVRAAAVEAAPSHRVDQDDGGGGGGPDDEGGAGAEEEDEESDGDDDATNAKNKAKRSEATSYGPNDDDDDAIQNEMQQDADLSGDEDEFEDEGFGGSPPPASGRRGGGGRSGDGAEEGEEEEEDDEEGQGGRGVPHAWGGLREERLVNAIAPMTQFSCDEHGGQWCRFTLEYETSTPKILMLNLVQDAIRKTVVQQIAGVRTCTYVPAQDRTAAKPEDAYISAEGINLVEMHKFAGMIDVTRIRTNDIYAVLTTYGVEACRLAIVSELVNVFSSHGITVDRRHLNLIGDFMTRNGAFTPFNRIGLRGNASPFTKMSFETTLAFLKDATLDGDWDELLTPSSRLVTGGLGKVGTGSFDVLTRLPTMWGGEAGASGMSS